MVTHLGFVVLVGNAPVSAVLHWVVGVAIVLGTASSVIRTLVVTRGMPSRLSAVLSDSVYWFYTSIARRRSDYRARDAILTWIAPMFIVAALFCWLLLFLLGYSLIISAEPNTGFVQALRQAGSSLFTLGFATAAQTNLDAIDFVAAATGPIVIALMISYLPALYASYNRREVSVALLHPRAGEPNWGPEILARNAIVDSGDGFRLDELWRAWTSWAADVGESHITYPTLIYMRSARPDRNWVVALLAVMDAAALQVTLTPSQHQGRARVLLRQGIETMRDLAASARIPHAAQTPADAKLQLTYDQFAEAVQMLEESNFTTEISAEQAWVGFARWRLNYEAVAYSLLMKIDAVPALWSGPRKPATAQIPPHRPRYIISGNGPGSETAD